MFVYRYFQKKDEQVDENIEVEEERPVIYNWWHKKLADYFENIDNVDRFVEVSAFSAFRAFSIFSENELLNC